MRITDLPSPGRINSSLELRRAGARAISYLQVSKRPDGKHPAAADVKAFFEACAAACDALVIE